MSHAIETAKALVNKGKSSICNPFYLNVDLESQQGKSILGQRTTFLLFHKFMFELTDTQLAQLNNGYKRYFSKNRIGSLDSVFCDLSLLKDAIDYQLCIRSADGFDVASISEDVVQSWQSNLKLAGEFEEITSKHLLDLADQMLEINEHSKLTKCGNALFGKTWQSQIAEALNVDSRRIRQWLAGERPVPDGVWSEIKVLAEQRKKQIEDLLLSI